jgi:hypothetical protein
VPTPQPPAEGAGALPPQPPFAPVPGQPVGFPSAQPPKKKAKGWLIALIIVVVLALAATAGVLVVRSLVGNRTTPYCQTYIRLGDEMPPISARLTQAQANGDFTEISSALAEMIAGFTELSDANPPADAVAPLDTVVDYLQSLKVYADNNDGDGYNAYVSANGSGAFLTASNSVDEVSVAYCS